MSPETLRGDGYDWKSDVWSMGIMLYEMAALRTPFEEEGLSMYGLFKKITRGEFEPIGEPYSDELRSLSARMIYVVPGERPELREVSRVTGFLCCCRRPRPPHCVRRRVAASR